MEDVALEDILKMRKEVEVAERRNTRRKRRRGKIGRKGTKRILKRGGSAEEKCHKCKYEYFLNQIWARTKEHTGL
jgi:hypothetical protein